MDWLSMAVDGGPAAQQVRWMPAWQTVPHGQAQGESM